MCAGDVDVFLKAFDFGIADVRSVEEGGEVKDTEPGDEDPV